MNNTEKLIASQYLVKQAIFGALLRGAGSRLASGLGKHFGGMGRFFKQNPIKATAVAGGGSLGGAALLDTGAAMAGDEPTFFKGMKDTALVKGFRELSNKHPLMMDLIAAGNPVIGPAYFASKLKGDTKKIFGKPDASKSPLLGEAGIYRGPQDFKPGLRAPGM